ncbi:unnamed protein product, partial [marine sediment metagenome]
KFYLGTHMPNFVELVNIPWFVSVTRVIDRKTRLSGDWMLDSGGFTQIQKYGKYNISEEKYLDVISIQNPGIAFCQDWMCEPVMLKKTGLTVKDHQEKTLESYLSLSRKSSSIRPVLQGWNKSDYVYHLQKYKKAGVNTNQLFGVGTICSRNGNPTAIREILKGILYEEPKLRLHGFGVKTDSLVACQDLLERADSMAWCYTAWKMEKLCQVG